MAHSFGDLLTQYRARKHGLSQAKLARLAGYDPSVITGMCHGGKALTGPLARERVVRVIGALRAAGVLSQLDEANALLAAAQMPPLQTEFVAEATLIRSLKSSPAAATASDASPTNLPAPPTSFIGREGEIAAINQQVQTARLLTLIGPPGVGKTRLSIEAARQMSTVFADGVWFIALAPVTELHTALVTMLQTLAVHRAPNLTVLEALTRHLRERETLLVLDNLEQILELGPALAVVLAAAPRVKAIATSREPLRISAEQRYRVQPLALDGDTSPAVELFVQRSRAIRPDFVLTVQTGPVIAEICRQLDGLPLAIELAAAQIEAFTPKELLARLDHRLATLNTGARDVPERQRTLRATIDWSYQLLSRDEQALFRRLGVFSGGFTLHAAQKFCELEHDLGFSAEHGLTALVTKNMLVREERPDDSSRYRMLETIREYALDRLAQNREKDVWQRRHAEYFAAAFASAQREMPEERANWHTAFEWTQSTPDADRLGLQLACCDNILGPAMSMSEGVRALSLAIAHPDAKRHPEYYIQALNALGAHLYDQGQLRQAQDILQKCLSMCREYDRLRSLLGRILHTLGITLRELGELEASHAYLEEGLQRALGLIGTDLPDVEVVRPGDYWAHMVYGQVAPEHYYITLGEVAIASENVLEAERYLNEGMRLVTANDVKLTIAWGLNVLGHLALLRGDLAQAKDYIAQSIRVLGDWGLDHHHILGCTAWGYQTLGEVALTEGAATDARTRFSESLTIFDEWIGPMGVSWCLCGLAGAAALDGEPERGARLWGAGEVLREKIGCRIAPASRRNRERTVAMLCKQLGDAQFAAEQAIGRAMSQEQAVSYALSVNTTFA